MSHDAPSLEIDDLRDVLIDREIATLSYTRDRAPAAPSLFLRSDCASTFHKVKPPRNLLLDTREYAITAVRPGGYAECNWLRSDLNLRTHSAGEFCLTVRQSIRMIE